MTSIVLLDPRIIERVRSDLLVVDGVVQTVTAAIVAVPVGEPSWRSRAQRSYGDRLAELDDLLRQCWKSLDEAASELKAQLADLERLAAASVSSLEAAGTTGGLTGTGVPR